MNDSSARVLHTRDDRGVNGLTPNRPAAFNTLNEEMQIPLQAAVDAVAADPGARMVVLARVRGVAMTAGCQLAGQTLACGMIHPGAQEGVQAFIDKRKPQWPAH